MCNLYALTKGQQALRELARALDLGAVADRLGNLPVLSSLYPDAEAPIIGLARGTAPNLIPGPMLSLARWGMPSPAFALAGKSVDRGITNIRNTASPHWRRWLAPQYRCLVPFTSFAEHVKTDTGFAPLWFAPADDSLACFAGIATRWTGVRKKAEGEVTLTVFGFLTCEPNAEVAPHHPKAMPVILTTPDEQRRWLTADWADAAALQRPLADGGLRVMGFEGEE
ncbi:SOS response-associated peptidase family protein [Sandarakinorhabdus sp.]|uniref:SOS response-associated peptidase n=1 Tax=Sandarakinorhabdus sp. TaxID=1916663 RepID=UPI00286DA9B8|nr:SOS response-associated peptidase family protein [Sandarakinorhabdus sp.]